VIHLFVLYLSLLLLLFGYLLLKPCLLLYLLPGLCLGLSRGLYPVLLTCSDLPALTRSASAPIKSILFIFLSVWFDNFMSQIYPPEDEIMMKFREK
jgi:hypothetical protein